MRRSVSFRNTGLVLGIAASCLFESSPAAGKPGSWRGQSVTEFSPEENAAFGWQIVNDGVMGGLSEGKLEFTASKTMKFSGNLSLENNGGFSTARSGAVQFNLSNDLGLLLLVKGDGRTYEARLDSDARFRGNPVSFAGKFTTVKGQWEQVKIPFSEFEGSFRGTELPKAVLNPSRIERIWVLLADKQEGPFNLEIDWIRTYGKGRGNHTESQREVPVESTGTSAGKSRLIATAVADGRFKTFMTALDTAGLTPFFQWDNPLTVFAPTDDAFAKLPDGDLEHLLKPGNREKLVALLSYHVSPGATGLADALKARDLKTVRGGTLEIGFSKGRVQVNDAQMVDGDLECSDGLIHVIDTVLLPPEPQKPGLKVVEPLQSAALGIGEGKS